MFYCNFIVGSCLQTFLVNSLHILANLYLPARVYYFQFSLTYFTMFKSILHSSTITEQNVKKSLQILSAWIWAERIIWKHFYCSKMFDVALPSTCTPHEKLFFILDVADDMFLFRCNGLNLVPLAFVYAPRHQTKENQLTNKTSTKKRHIWHQI